MVTTARRSIRESALVVADDDGLHIADQPALLTSAGHIGSLAVGNDAVWVLADGSELSRVTNARSAEQVATFEHATATCVHVHRDILFVGDDEEGLWRLGGHALEPAQSFRRAPAPREWQP